MVQETLKLKEFFFPDLDFRVMLPEKWQVSNRLADAEGSLMNAVWVSPKDSAVLMNASMTVYQTGGATQKDYFDKHIALYEGEKDTEIIESGESGEFDLPFHFIRVEMRKAGLEMAGLIAFHVTEKFSYILQLISPVEHFESTRPLWTAILSSFKPVVYVLPDMPPKPGESAQDAHGGWIVNVPPMTVENEIIPSAAFFHEDFGFGIQIPSDSVWAAVGENDRWAILFQMPYKLNELSASVVVQALGGGAITSAQLMDGVETQLLRERNGTRKSRTTFSAAYGALEYMHAVYAHGEANVASHVYVHARADRSFIVEVLIPEGSHPHGSALAYTIANGFTVYKPVNAVGPK